MSPTVLVLGSMLFVALLAIIGGVFLTAVLVGRPARKRRH